MKQLIVLSAALALGACATAQPPGGFLSSYEGLAPRSGAVRASIAERRDADGLAAVKRVRIAPTELRAESDWMTEAERRMLLREVDAQLCFELSERYDIVAEAPDAEVRAAVTQVRPTGRVGSVASVAAGFFIPGPIGLRAPGTLGALGAEAEMIAGGRQVAAIAWSRGAMAVGTDNPSLSRIGDALQFAEPFADTAAEVMTAPGVQTRKISAPDPCTAFGRRFRPEGVAARVITGFYVPQMSGARPEDAAPAATEPAE